MDDTISRRAALDVIDRQALIEAVEEVPWYHQNKNGEMVHGANSDEHQAWYKAEDIYHVLDTLPPAQPVAKDINVPVKDCISRAAALTALERDEEYDKDIPNRADGVRDAIITISALPSAQPTGTNTVQVDDCISREAAIEAMRKAKDKSELHRMLVQLPSAQPGWIPVTERLPKKDGDYLVTTHSGQIARYIFIGGSSEEYWRRCATAWMPLPTPYREGGQDG